MAALKMQTKADMKVIKVWRNMSVLQLADAMDKDLGIVSSTYFDKGIPQCIYI